MAAFSISGGFTAEERPRAAQLYWQAFGGKLGRVLGPEERALAFLAPALRPEYALVARDPAESLIGLAGFKTETGAMVGGGIGDLAAVYGWFGALWRATLLSVLERDVVEGALLMDGICVAPEARGLGVGTALLAAIKAKAAELQKSAVRLDVIDSNPRARALYEREGFVPVGVERLGLLRHVFGFASATRMQCSVSDRRNAAN